VDGHGRRAQGLLGTGNPGSPVSGKPPIAYDWYREFVATLLAGGHYTWFSKLVIAGELAIGIALIIGAFTGIAAFAGGFMNWNFLMAGTAATNPLLFAIATWLVLAWKTAGWIGADRYLLPYVGTPWKPGALFTRRPFHAEAGAATAGR